MNFWFWLFIIIIPAIVFSVKPEANLWLRIGRLVLAGGLAYLFLNLSLHLKLDRMWEAYNSCRFEHSGNDGPYEMSLALKMDKICPPAPNTGAPLAFYLVLGWIPAAGYSGLWELLWRLRHHDFIRTSGKSFRGKWISNALIIFSVIAAYPTWIFLGPPAY
ncbi:MAG: hypothetical protein ABL951_00055 [Alphaproteobacteria bacterium]